jgi:acetyl esterase/lipase
MKKPFRFVICFAMMIGPLSGCLSPDLANSPRSSEPISTESPSKSPTEVNLLTADEVSLKAFYYPALNLGSDTRTLMLLHGAFEDHRSWNEFINSAQAEGYAVFTLDLRGHGQSGGEKTFDESMDLDVEAAFNWLKDSADANMQQVALIGESLGASLVLRAGVRHPEIPAVILLSPGMHLWEIKIDEAITNYGSRPLLLVSSEEDSYPAGTVRQLDEQAQGPHELLLLPGAAHGTKMFSTNPNLANQILIWLHETAP